MTKIQPLAARIDEHESELRRHNAIVFSNEGPYRNYTVIAATGDILEYKDHKITLEATRAEELMTVFLKYLRQESDYEDATFLPLKPGKINGQELNGLIYTPSPEERFTLDKQGLIGVNMHNSIRVHPPRDTFRNRGFSGGSLGDIANSITLFTLPLDYPQKDRLDSLLRDYVREMTNRTTYNSTELPTPKQNP